MVRCCKCQKSFKQHLSKCWDDGMCGKCWKENKKIKFVPPKTNTRILNTPIDFYLDQYVVHEVQNLDN